MLFDGNIWLGTSPEGAVCLLPSLANRNGLIAGATGTGKTVTLQVLAEGFSQLGVPVFLYAYDWGTYHEKRSFNIDLARDVPTLFTDDPSVLVKAIERDAFEPERYQCFVRNNITLPTHGTCTNHLCRYILKLVQQTDC